MSAQRPTTPGASTLQYTCPENVMPRESQAGRASSCLKEPLSAPHSGVELAQDQFRHAVHFAVVRCHGDVGDLGVEHGALVHEFFELGGLVDIGQQRSDPAL